MNSIRWDGSKITLLDQTKLPLEISFVECNDEVQTAEAIKKLVVRGAPAIGVAAAYAMVMAMMNASTTTQIHFHQRISEAATLLKNSRPTAVNLFWAVDRILAVVNAHPQETTDRLCHLAHKEADAIYHEDIRMNQQIGAYGLSIIPKESRVLTYCNAGSLATAGYGTALGVIRAAHAQDRIRMVYAGETRPLLQGARLTAWELHQDAIPVTLIADNMAGHLMQKGQIDLVIVGADRIAANGDAANKIGTYTMAVLAKAHGIPFYVAAPYSTVDMAISTGNEIVIEERSGDEIRRLKDIPIVPEYIHVYNPAFDVTPHDLITALITDQGVLRPPYFASLKNMFKQRGEDR